MAAGDTSRQDAWREVSRTRLEAQGRAVDAVLSIAPGLDDAEQVVLTLEGVNCNLEGEMPGEYWLVAPEQHQAAVKDALDRGPIVYCASEMAIDSAVSAYVNATGQAPDPRGFAAAMIAAHHRRLGLDRSVCLRDLVDAPERAAHVRPGGPG